MVEGPGTNQQDLDKRRVMLIDDDEDIRTVLAEALEDFGLRGLLRLQRPRSLDSAVSAGYRCPARILLDLDDAGHGWLAVPAREQLENPDIAPIPVVVISAVNPGKALPEGTILLRKPFDLDVMLVEVERAIG